MFACPLGVPGLGELPLKLGVLDNLVSGVCSDTTYERGPLLAKIGPKSDQYFH